MQRTSAQKPGHRPGFFVFGEIGAGRGFTVVELIVVIVIAGILAATILPRFSGKTGFEERQLRDETVAALRYAQKSAIAARRTVCASFPSATQAGFRISTNYPAADCTVGSDLQGPQGSALTVTAKGGAQYSPLPAAIVFDAQGRPTNGAVTVSVAGLPASLAVAVEAETGYVH